MRYLKLSKYRNLGLDNEETLVLNNGLNDKSLGDVIILIGPNNSGKSNILDALSEVSAQKMQERDKTTLSFETNDLQPHVVFGVEDDEASLTYDVSLGGTCCKADINKNKAKFDYDACVIEFKTWIPIFDKNFPNYQFGKQCLEELKSIGEKSEDKLNNAITSCLNQYKNRNCSCYNNAIREINLSTSPLQEIVLKMENDNLSRANLYMQSKYGISFIPQIIVYKERSLSQHDLETTIGSLHNSLFFGSVFKAIDIDQGVIENAYAQYRNFRNKAILNKIKKQIDKKIDKVSEEFNKMYFTEKDKYHFAIELDENNISFSMSRGVDYEPIMISYQSTGFRWFFNLFFNFLCSNELHAGDIIIMDEPAASLHPEGKRELHRFLKEFAIKNGLTFVMATHSPFLIDTDNFDELRIVRMENNRSTICNLFTAVDASDPDSLKPIKESLAIKQNVLYDIDTEVVFVEGIVDYNYLTFFKNALGYKNLSFLPFQGAGENSKMQDKILKELKNIRFHKRGLLLDGDEAGVAIKEKCQNTDLDNAICISDAFENKKEIKDLFSKEDQNKFDVSNSNKECFKKASASSILKKTSVLDDFSKETIDNFKKLFERIID